MVAAGSPSPWEEIKPALSKIFDDYFLKILITRIFSLGTDYAHVFPICDTQEIQVFQQGDGMGHLQRKEFCRRSG